MDDDLRCATALCVVRAAGVAHDRCVSWPRAGAPHLGWIWMPTGAGSSVARRRRSTTAGLAGATRCSSGRP
jgi:hypothetical protein